MIRAWCLLFAGVWVAAVVASFIHGGVAYFFYLVLKALIIGGE